MTNSTQIPAEWADEIKNKAKAYMQAEVKGMTADEELQPHHLKYAHEAGATEYAHMALQYLADEQKAIRVTSLALQSRSRAMKEYAAKLHHAEEEGKRLIRVLLETEQAKQDELQVRCDMFEAALKDIRNRSRPQDMIYIISNKALEWKGEKEPAPLPAQNRLSVFIPCDENDPRASGSYTSNCGRSLCHVRETTVPVIEQGAVWVKGQYDRLYEQVKNGKWVACYVDYNTRINNIILRDICQVIPDTMEFVARGIAYGYPRSRFDPSRDEKQSFIELCEEMHVEWLDESAGEKEDRKGLEWLHNPIIEFCYRHADGRVEVKYRRIEGTPECDELKAEVEKLIESAKPDVSPYFYRKEGEKEVKPPPEKG